MADEIQIEPSPALSERSGMWLEVLAVLSLVSFPHILISIERHYVTATLEPAFQPSATTAAWLGALVCCCLIPALLFVAKHREGDLSRFGLAVGVRWLYVLVIPLFLADRFAAWLGYIWAAPDLVPPSFESVLWIRPWGHLHGDALWLVGTILHTGAFTFITEFAMRGYLIRRVIDLTGRPWLAVFTSSLLISLVFVGSGMWAVLPLFLSGLVYGRFFRFSGSIWPGFIVQWLFYLLITFCGP